MGVEITKNACRQIAFSLTLGGNITGADIMPLSSGPSRSSIIPTHTPRSAAPPPRKTTPAGPAQGDVVAEELTSKLTQLEDKLRKELLGLGNEPPEHALEVNSMARPTAASVLALGGSA